MTDGEIIMVNSDDDKIMLNNIHTHTYIFFPFSFSYLFFLLPTKHFAKDRSRSNNG